MIVNNLKLKYKNIKMDARGASYIDKIIKNTSIDVFKLILLKDTEAFL